MHAAYVSGHYASVGFLGNTNYVGTFLAAPALAAIVVAIVAAGKRRWVYAVIAGLLVSGLALSASRTAVVALLAGLVVLVARLRRGWLVVAGAIVVVALTAYAMKGDDDRAREAGCDGYVSKPIDTRALPALVSKFLQDGAR